MPKALFEFNRSSRNTSLAHGIEIREAASIRPQNWFEKYVGGWSGGSVIVDMDGKWFPTSAPFDVLKQFAETARDLKQTKPLDLSCHTQWSLLPHRTPKGEDIVLAMHKKGEEAVKNFVAEHFAPMEQTQN